MPGEARAIVDRLRREAILEKARRRVQRARTELEDAELALELLELGDRHAPAAIAVTAAVTVVVTEKVCIDCGFPKPLDEFYRVHRDSEDRQSRCKLCDNTRRAAVSGEHGPRATRDRKPTHPCKLCFGLAHRVEGDRCEGCGLPFSEEANDAV